MWGLDLTRVFAHLISTPLDLTRVLAYLIFVPAINAVTRSPAIDKQPAAARSTRTPKNCAPQFRRESNK
jgi:hypothetical protein